MKREGLKNLLIEWLIGLYNSHFTKDSHIYYLSDTTFHSSPFTYLLIFLFLINSCYAYELDTSVDDEIRRNYNPSALENSLPALPKVTPTQTTSTTQTPPKTQPVTQPAKPQIVVKKLPTSQIDKSTAIRIPKGTKFKVRSSASLSDTTRVGARLTFTTLQPVTKRYVTIPTGTVFNAVVVNSHPPQITGNGGLLQVKVDGIKYNSKNFYSEGKVTKANNKKVFVNNIKGQRQYWKGVVKQVNKGQNFYKKTRRVSNNLTDNPITLIVAPVPTIVGMGVYAVNLVGSPIFSIGHKGGRLSIPAGSEFEIKLQEDIYLEY